MQRPFLMGEKIYLRAINESDLNENYLQWFNDAEVCRFNSHHRFPNTAEKMQAYFNNVIKSESSLVLAIIDKSSDKHIGNTALHNIDYIDRLAEFVIVIGDKDFWGQGIGKEAAQLIIGHGFRFLNLHRIYCGTSIENIGMQKLAAALGFKQEGISRAALYKNGFYKDIINYGLLNDEYKD